MGCNASSASIQKPSTLEDSGKSLPRDGATDNNKNETSGTDANENGAKMESEISQTDTIFNENVALIPSQVSSKNDPAEITHPSHFQDIKHEESSKTEHLGLGPSRIKTSETQSTNRSDNQTIGDDVTKPLFQSNTSSAESKADEVSSNLALKQKDDLDSTQYNTETENPVNSNNRTIVQTEIKSETDGTEENSENKMEEQTTPQEEFHTAIRCSCSLLDPEILLKYANEEVTFLQLNRSLPYNYSLLKLLSRLPNLQELDVSGNSMGAQPFRLLMLSMSHNTSITWLNAANNMTDTDSAESIGIMLTKNRTLLYLDVSGNYLGKDYFSRCVGPALALNDSLLVLKCEGIGSTDMTALMENLKKNTTLQELNINHNQMVQPEELVAHLVEMLTSAGTQLSSLEMRNCNLDDKDLVAIATALETNQTIVHLNLASNTVTSHNALLKVILASLQHKLMTSLNLDDTKVMNPNDAVHESTIKVSATSPMESLSLANCSLSNTHLEALLLKVEGSTLANLRNLNLTNNLNLKIMDMAPVVAVCLKGLKRLSLGLNDCQNVELLQRSCPEMKLHYLNLRKAKVKYDTIKDINQLFDQHEEATLVLDGIKFSGSGMKELKDLLVNFRNVSALSLGGCCLSDGDMQLLCDVINSPGLPLHMLKLAANRISDKGVNSLVEALVSHESHPLQLIDLSDNQITSKGANKLCELFKHSSHRSQIHSLNISRNNIDTVGLKALASLIGQSPVTCLHLNNQSATFTEEEVEDICEEVAKGLGIQISKDGDDVRPGCSRLELLPPSGIVVKLTGLAGEAGQFGKHLDSVAIPTDYSKKMFPYVSMRQVADLSAHLLAKEKCEISSEEYDLVINAKKEFPHWLKVSENWDRTVYLSHLPASVTVQKMEGVFENEVDCEVTEVYLMKDPISRKNNGFAWALLGSKGDVEKAMEYMNSGEAQVYSQPYIISPLNLSVQLDPITASDTMAQSDIAARQATRRREEEQHRALLRKSYLESQERHAYRLAHPAYADGRIW